MNAIEAADRTREFIELATDRMTGVGADQYQVTDIDSGQVYQRFEFDHPSELVEAAKEELLDLANYAAMTWIRLDALQQKLVTWETTITSGVRDEL